MKNGRLAKIEADKATEGEEEAQEADGEALSSKAEEMKMSEDKDELVVIDEHHKIMTMRPFLSRLDRLT
ncbi:hypothetical protein Forpe1208_v012404 [Fusarium oxysporum f. sp. rapae]|uniref:Uncharacterized protein n=1 Tax=Fusarium oxysporum f. sp. rapae TaxID=485398 RepID=A0A8J5NP52_FUSOX|nr:hypothetical protein Forpe1208_v012404 [Fusarium oxysporum f. sp. rapae]